MGAELRPICPACLVDSLVVVEVFLKSNDRVILNNTSLLARYQLSQFDVAAVTSTCHVLSHSNNNGGRLPLSL